MWLVMDLQGCSSLTTYQLLQGGTRDQGAEPCIPQGHCAMPPPCTASPQCPMCWEGSMGTAPRLRCLLFPNPA